MKLDFSKLTGHLVVKASSVPDAYPGPTKATPTDWLAMIAALDARVELYCRASGQPAHDAIGALDAKFSHCVASIPDALAYLAMQGNRRGAAHYCRCNHPHRNH